jgi:chromosomal replication initiation ATPase DnaA
MQKEEPEKAVVRELPPLKEPWFSVVPDDGSDRILIADITKACARRFKIPLHDLKSHSRVGGLIRARFIMYFLACALSGRSSVYVGRRLGRDHATVLHGKKLVEKWREKDTCVEMDLRTIAAAVGGSLG